MKKVAQSSHLETDEETENRAEKRRENWYFTLQEASLSAGETQQP